jgi:phospholipid/cholesterol/gamma-HCH transport system ATP-binding protein
MSSASEPLIRVEGLTMGYGPSAILQKDASFDVHAGEVFVILGGSGCGKSTLLRHLIGLQRPMAGTIRFLSDLRTPDPDGDAPSFGVTFQDGALFGSMTVGQNVALPLQAWTDMPEEAVDALVRARLRLVGLGGFENHYPSEISGGMKKRASIARALALEPRLLFLDEPSAGLDPISAVQLDDLILTLNRSLGVTVVIVTHELESIFRIGTRCIFLDKASQSIIADGDPRELRDGSEDPRVRDFFNRRSPREAG